MSTYTNKHQVLFVLITPHTIHAHSIRFLHMYLFVNNFIFYSSSIFNTLNTKRFFTIISQIFLYFVQINILKYFVKFSRLTSTMKNFKGFFFFVFRSFNKKLPTFLISKASIQKYLQFFLCYIESNFLFQFAWKQIFCLVLDPSISSRRTYRTFDTFFLFFR